MRTCKHAALFDKSRKSNIKPDQTTNIPLTKHAQVSRHVTPEPLKPNCTAQEGINWEFWLLIMPSCPPARSIPLIQRGLRERLLSERWGKVSLHLRKHPLQPDAPSLLERSALEDVHGGTECRPVVSSPCPLHSFVCSLMSSITENETFEDCLWFFFGATEV